MVALFRDASHTAHPPSLHVQHDRGAASLQPDLCAALALQTMPLDASECQPNSGYYN